MAFLKSLLCVLFYYIPPIDIIVFMCVSKCKRKLSVLPVQLLRCLVKLKPNRHTLPMQTFLPEKYTLKSEILLDSAARNAI